jgi:hypothetical protein
MWIQANRLSCTISYSATYAGKLPVWVDYISLPLPSFNANLKPAVKRGRHVRAVG